MTDEKYKVEKERYFSSHLLHRAAAMEALKRAEGSSRANRIDCMAAIVFCALELEALTNDIGFKIVSRWQTDFEQAPTSAKLRYLCERLTVELDWGREPWQTANEILKIRNRIVHGKPESIKDSDDVIGEDPDVPDSYHRRRPNSKLENQLTETMAKRAVENIERIRELLILKVPAEDRFGLFNDMWMTSVSVVSEGAPSSDKEASAKCHEKS